MVGTDYIWLAVFLIGAVSSVMFHEVGHVTAGLRYGWEVAGYRWRYLMVGGGVQMGHRSSDFKEWRLPRVAFAGPVASLVLAGVFWVLATIATPPGDVFINLMWLNVFIAGINLIPTPMTDGGHIVLGLFGKRMKWRHFFGVWIAVEIIAVVIAYALGWRLL